MKTWRSPTGELRLKRYPFTGLKSHQAWDAADDWILGRFNSHSSPILIAGEAFGVLGTAWGDADIIYLNDSLMSMSALAENRGMNPQKCRGRLSELRTTDPAQAGKTVEKIFIRLPKSLELLDIYIRISLGYASAETEIWLGGMEKRWNSGVMKITRRYFDRAGVFPFERHARWISFHKKEALETPLGSDSSGRVRTLEKYPVKLLSAPAVFSSSALDQGTAAFLEAFPERETVKAERIADLGCGSGVLGLCAAYLNSEAEIVFCDESYLAVRAASGNSELNGFSLRSEFHTANGFEGIPGKSIDLVLCNPPFHYHNIQSLEPAEFMFSEARRVLKPGGALQIVGNNHLGYHKHLKKYFPDARTVFQNKKFTVLRASAK